MPVSQIFITGASGYIGGSVLSVLLKYPQKYAIKALVRSKDQAEGLKKVGVTPVFGSLDDTELLYNCAKGSDAVVHTANIEHLPSVQSLVNGLRAKNDKRAVLLHTSGTDVLTFSPYRPITVPFDDMDMNRLHSIPPTAPHKDVDAWVLENTDEITAAIIAPSTINGIGTGLFNKTSVQVPALIKAACSRRKAGWVGPRTTAVWGNVNIHDLVELYRLVLDGLLSDTIPSGREGWYFANTTEHAWLKVAEELGRVLYTFGLVETAEISEFENDYVEKYLWGDLAKCYYGGDSRCLATRSKQLGWRPTHPNVFETLEQEVKYMIENGGLE